MLVELGESNGYMATVPLHILCMDRRHRLGPAATLDRLLASPWSGAAVDYGPWAVGRGWGGEEGRRGCRDAVSQPARDCATRMDRRLEWAGTSSSPNSASAASVLDSFAFTKNGPPQESDH